MMSRPQWREYFQYLKQRMVRQKENDPHNLKTELRRCLSMPELTCLGVGNTIGVGIYVLLGVIAKENAGPSTILCFLIAIGVTMLNALVYAEFSSSITQTGASYTFLYKVCGEFIAFIFGWLMIISSLCSACVGARAWSGLLDSFFDRGIQDFSKSVLGEIQFGRPFAEYLDLSAFAFQAVVTLIVSCNVRCSSILTTTLSIITVSVLLFVAGAGFIFGDVANFVNKDNGGFFPFGISGVIKGSSLAIYACSGFEIVSMSAEEAKDPQKSVPRATILELITVASVYVAAALGLLFLIPYWLIDTAAPLPSAFDHAGMVWGKFIVTLGPLFSFTNLQMLNLYGLSRMLYRMASDGLFFKFFLHVHKKTGVPVNSIVFIGILTSILSLVFDLSFLVEITILLMLITYVFLGSALIKLKVTKSQSLTQMQSSDSDNVQPPCLESMSSKHSKGNGYHRLEDKGSLNNLADFDDNSVKEDDGDLTTYSINSSGKDITIENDTSPFEEGHLGSDERQLERDGSDSEDNEDAILFDKEFLHKSKYRESPNNCRSQDIHTPTTNSISTMSDGLKSSLRLRIATKCFPFVPGVLSFNVVILMHWLCCIGLALQINYGWRDLMNASVVALCAISSLLLVLVLLTTILWVNKIEDSISSFQTPLMPLIPTLSMILSCILFFSSTKIQGFVEMGVLFIAGSLLYTLLIYMDMSTTSDVFQDEEQSMALIGEDTQSINDEL